MVAVPDLRRLLDAVPDIVVVIDRFGTVKFANAAAHAVLGLEPDAWVGRTGFDLVHPDDIDEAVESLLGTVAAEDGVRRPIQLRLLTGDGTWLPVELLGNSRFDDPDIDGIVLSGRPAHAHDVVARGVREAEERFRVAFEQAPIGIALVALEGHWLRVNPALARMLGYSTTDLVRRRLHDLAHPEDADVDREEMDELRARGDGHYEVEKRYVSATGSVVWTLQSVAVVRGETGTASYFVIQLQDITDRKRAEADLFDFAMHDPLTHLPNRRLLEDRLGQSLRRAVRADPRVAVMFIDLDGFKAVNDKLGHIAGDAVLIDIATRLRLLLRPGDTLGRLGGDEFVAILEDADEAVAAKVAGRVREATLSPIWVDGTSVRLSASVGIAVAKPGNLDPTALLREADRKMYEHKPRPIGHEGTVDQPRSSG